jgi:hypothetical protein
MSKEKQDGERNCADVLSVAVQLWDERRHKDHEDVVNVDGKQAIEIMQRKHDEMGGRASNRCEHPHVHEALTPDDVWVSRDNANGQEPVDPGWQMDGLPRGLSEKVA